MEETDSLLAESNGVDSADYGTSSDRKNRLVKGNSSRRATLLPSLLTVYGATLTSEMARGLLFPTLWLKVETVYGSTTPLGVVVGAFSVGRIIGTPIFGALSDHVNSYRSTLITCNVILLLGAILYGLSQSLLALITAQFVMGLGAGSLGTLRSYVAETAPRVDRTEHMAYLTALQYAGFIVTPAIGALLSSTAAEHELWFLNRFTAPICFLVFVTVVSIYALQQWLQEVRRPSSSGEELENDHVPSRSEELRIDTEEDESSSRTIVCLAGCILNFFAKGTVAIFETLIVMFAVQQLGWSTLQAGLSISLCGLVAFGIMISFQFLLRVVDDVDLIVIGWSVMVAGCLLLDSTVLPQVTSWRCYAALVLMFAIGYPVGHTSLIGVYSKIIESGPQGTFLGVFAASGSLARIVFPAASVWLVQQCGFSAAFSFAAVMLSLCLIFLLMQKKAINYAIRN
eukprot:gene2203-2406_t